MSYLGRVLNWREVGVASGTALPCGSGAVRISGAFLGVSAALLAADHESIHVRKWPFCVVTVV
jgi:hypothetical protein